MARGRLFPKRCSQDFRCGMLASFIFCTSLLFFNYSTSSGVNNSFISLSLGTGKTTSPTKLCSGHYIYIHDDLPSKFNSDLLTQSLQVSTNHISILRPHDLTLTDCTPPFSEGTDRETISSCAHIVNMGFGPNVDRNSEGVLSNNKSWYFTNPYLLDVIFHSKMKRYQCLTKDYTLASAIYVPFYAGVDIWGHQWDSNLTDRDSSAKQFVKWLSMQPLWKNMWGRDHFFVSGVVSWDFRRLSDNSSDWGSNLRFLPESMNMTMLSIEGSKHKNDIAIPYPTNFHPADKSEVVQWQNKVRKQERPYLFAFVGAPRPQQQGSIRGKLIDHCLASTKCKFLHCGENDCANPVNVMGVFQRSVYCLQPAGDTYTRRSTFDAFLAGCIPVFFHPATAYTQYVWYLPKNHTMYSVYIPVRDVKDLKVGRIEKTLLAISKDRELEMREEVVRLIPNLVYAAPGSRLKTQDAFDIALQGILERIESVRKAIREGRDPSIGFADDDGFQVMFREKLDY